MFTRHRVAGAVWSAALIVGILAGLPALLWWAGGNPAAADTWRDLADGWGDGLAPQITPTAVARALAALCWVCWLFLAVAVVAELYHASRGGTARRVRGLSVFQGVASTVVAPLALLLATLPAPARPAAAIRPAIPAVAVETPTMATHTTAETRQASTPAPGCFRVRPGDTLDRIAEELWGDPLRWRDLWEANKHRVQNDGRTFTQPTGLRSGWDLEIPDRPAPAGVNGVAPSHPSPTPPAPVTPAATTAAQPTRAVPAMETWTVEAGQSLWRIVELAYGVSDAPTVAALVDGVYHHNADRLQSPDELAEGMTLHLPTLTLPVAGALAPSAPAAAPNGDAGELVRHVQPGDTLTAIVSAFLGRPAHPDEVTAVFDANVGVTDPAGRFVLADPDLIHPAQPIDLAVLAAQPDAPPAPAPSTETPAAPTGPTAPSSPSPSDPAPAPPSAPPAQPPAEPTPPSLPPPPTTPAAPAPPSLPPPPTTPALPAPAPPTAPTPSTVPAAPTTAATTAAADPTRSGDAQDAGGETRDGAPAPRWLLPGGILGCTLLATGAAKLIGSRRQRRLRAAGPGDVPVPADPSLAPTETAVHAAADVAGIDRLAATLQGVAARLVRQRCDAVVEAVMRHPDGEIELFLSTPCPARAPFEARGGERIWALDAHVDIAEFVGFEDDFSAVAPALVMLGTLDDDAELYVDVEAVGVIHLDAPGQLVRDVARAVTASVAVSPFVDACEVVVVGFDPGSFGVGQRLTPVASLAEGLAHAQPGAARIARALADTKLASSFQLRALGEDTWEPVVVVSADADVADDLLVGLADLVVPGGRGVGALVTGPVPDGCRWRLVFEPAAGTWRVEPFGMRLRPVAVAADELVNLAALLEVADTPLVTLAPPTDGPLPPPPEILAVDSPDGTDGLNGTEGADPFEPPMTFTLPTRVPSPVAGSPAGGFVEADWHGMICLLGTLTVCGPDGRPPTSPPDAKGVELLAWAAEHPHATKQQAETALWPGQEVHRRLLNNHATAIRKTLAELAGAPPDSDNGQSWLELTRGKAGGYRLPDGLVTDAALLDDRLAFARTAEPAVALDVLRPGLDLVRGAPFEGSPAAWEDLDHISQRLRLRVVAAAIRATEAAVALADLDAALWCSARGFRAIPAHEDLVCLRMQAHGQAGGLSAVKAEFHSYQQALSRDRYLADTSPSPKVLATYRRLMAGIPAS